MPNTEFVRWTAWHALQGQRAEVHARTAGRG